MWGANQVPTNWSHHRGRKRERVGEPLGRARGYWCCPYGPANGAKRDKTTNASTQSIITYMYIHTAYDIATPYSNVTIFRSTLWYIKPKNDADTMWHILYPYQPIMIALFVISPVDLSTWHILKVARETKASLSRPHTVSARAEFINIQHS